MSKRPRSNSTSKVTSPGLRSLAQSGAVSPNPELSPSPAKKRRKRTRSVHDRALIFRKQLKQETDFTFVCGGAQIPVHSMLLSARSDVFDRMFSGAFKEATERNCEISDARPEELIEFVKFFYPKLALKIRRNGVTQMLYMAEKYQVAEVKKRCEQCINCEMQKERTVARMLPWLKLAFDYKLTQLQEAITTRIAKRFPNFDRTPTFRALPAGLRLEVVEHSKAVLSGRLDKIRDIAFDTQTGEGHDSASSSYQRTYKNRVINIQSYYNNWDDKDAESSKEESDEPVHTTDEESEIEPSDAIGEGGPEVLGLD